MKLPSIQYLFKNAKNSFVRFPLTILSSLAAVVIGIYLTECHKSIDNIFPYINIILTSSLGISLFFCATIISSKKKFDKKNNLLIHAFAALILVAIYLTLPSKESTHNTTLPYIKYALYSITSHLLVSFIPFAFTQQLNGFWQYNKTLFIRFLTSTLYSGFIYVGLILALSALNLLFDIKIHNELYFDIWVTVAGFFNTWFFVSGIPQDLDELEINNEYPSGLKTFSQYVLLPLLALYLIILYAYGSKILMLWDWPKGIVTYLIICVSVLGILTFLLLYPYGNQNENSWIKKSSKAYYFALIPLLVILYIAIFMRIDDYGITINRYIILILGVWLTILCLYTAIGKTNIKFIPTSLALIAILISFGPWGMFSVSEKSQVKRLEKILTQSKVLVKGKVQNETILGKENITNQYGIDKFANEKLLSDSLHNEVKSILDYLDDHHGFSLIRKWYKQNIDSIISIKDNKKGNSYLNYEAETYMRSLGLKYEHIYTDSKKLKLEYNAGYNNNITEVTGYDYVIDFNKYNYNQPSNDISTFKIDSIEYSFNISEKNKLILELESKSEKFAFDLNELINNLQKEYGKKTESSIPISKMQQSFSNDKFLIKLELHSITIETSKKDPFIENITGKIFVKKKV